MFPVSPFHLDPSTFFPAPYLAAPLSSVPASPLPRLTAILADLVVVLHFLFVLFVVLGGLLVLRWPRLAYVHLPAAIWGAAIEFAGWVCPLTPLEHWLRRQSGTAPYVGGFIEHYILPLLYPAALTREIQILLGVLVLVINLGVYAYLIRRRRSKKAAALQP
ncbi:MAG TPA: DUF2784 domain-containing protein [Gemmatimonadales bacterium]|nr:DUF2784 domain-containing protein [Gemmatimonadales bacterium]